MITVVALGSWMQWGKVWQQETFLVVSMLAKHRSGTRRETFISGMAKRCDQDPVFLTRDAQ